MEQREAWISGFDHSSHHCNIFPRVKPDNPKVQSATIRGVFWAFEAVNMYLSLL